AVALGEGAQIEVDHVVTEAAPVRIAAQVRVENREPVRRGRAGRAAWARPVGSGLDRRVQPQQVGLRRAGLVQAVNAGQQDRVEIGAACRVDVLQGSASVAVRRTGGRQHSYAYVYL